MPSIHSEEEDDDDVPQDLKDLIDESIQDTHSNPLSSSNPNMSDMKTSVTASDLADFFLKASQALKTKETTEEIVTGLEDLKKRKDNVKVTESTKPKEVEEGEEEVGEVGDEVKKVNPENQLQVIRKVIEKCYSQVWTSMKIDPMIGKHAVATAETALNNDKLSAEIRKKLDDNIDKFTRAEHETVGTYLLGKEEYESRQRQKNKVENAKEELKEELDEMDPQKRGQYVLELKQKGMEFRERLMAMGQQKAIEYMDKPTTEDEELLTKLSALTLLMQESGGGHGHSHNGQPCTGHGHADHGHSHESHGHSHDSHGHSHDSNDHGHSHAKPPPPVQQQQHGHSHNGKACHGHN